jgi:hypothetical protein
VLVRARTIAFLALTALVTAAGARAATGAQPQLSANWAGYAATAPADATLAFANATGTWTMPRVRCRKGRSDAVAFWVGLGGYLDGTTSLEQLGTAAECGGTRTEATYYAWWEVVPAAAVRVSLRVRPGDRVTAGVAVDGKKVVFSLIDRTHGTRFSRVMTTAQQLDVASAEWIAEAPASCVSPVSCSTVPISDFGRVTFTDIALTAGSHPGTLADATWAAAPIKLVTGLDGAAPGGVSADGRSFAVSWRHGPRG